MDKTTTTDTQAMALALASATQMCPRTDRHEHVDVGFTPGVKSPWVTGKGQECVCEVYVLGPEVRVKCEFCGGRGFNNHPLPNVWARKDIACQECSGENLDYTRGRGWNPLDPRYGWDWMVALGQAEIFITVRPFPTMWVWDSKCEAQASIGVKIHFAYANSPELAFFQATVKALNLPTETETK